MDSHIPDNISIVGRHKTVLFEYSIEHPEQFLMMHQSGNRVKYPVACMLDAVRFIESYCSNPKNEIRFCVINVLGIGRALCDGLADRIDPHHNKGYILCWQKGNQSEWRRLNV